jgi:hypothetical protein
MNDFSELENELKKLQPARPSAELLARINAAFTNQTTDPHLNPLPEGEADAERRVRVTHSASRDTAKIIRPARFNPSWLSIGLGLAAAAAFLVFAHIRVDHPAQSTQVAQTTPAPETGSTIEPRGRERDGWATRRGELSGENESSTSPGYLPAGATQVTYHTRDEGLHFARGYEAPMRRVRTQKRETQQWRNPDTGASLQISYPSEEVVLTPVSGQ